jgi:4-hydroxy-4-methyl-2-oxoglutarate aldolase
MRPIYAGAKAFGTALTVLSHPGDNLMMHAAAALCRPGNIIVVALTSESTDAMLGDLLATSFRAHGGVGAVIDAGCRDVAELTRMQFPVWSKAISAKGTVKNTLGAINVPVVCAGQLVRPGDVVLADDDGIVVVPPERLAEVVEASRQREEKEARMRERLAAGELGLDIYGLREKLAKMGLVIE